MKKLGVTHIVNLAGKALYPGQFEYLQHHFKDSDETELFPLIKDLMVDLARLEGQQKRVLVHCLGGINRSPAVVVAFLMMRNQISFQDALALVRDKRKAANPRNYFPQLQKFEEEARLIRSGED